MQYPKEPGMDGYTTWLSESSKISIIHQSLGPSNSNLNDLLMTKYRLDYPLIEQ